MGPTVRGGLEGQLHGVITEFRFFRAFQAPVFGSPYWFNSIRRATAEEDSRGIDAFAELDMGTVQVQIKSSFSGQKRHVEQYGSKHCIIVIPEEMDAARIRSHTFNRLFLWRKQYLSPRKSKKRRAR